MTAEEFEELYHEFWGLVYSRCLASRGDVEEALDATMEVFVRKWAAIDRYDPCRASFKTWLMQNTNHLCIDLMRKASHRQEVPLEEASEEPEVESGAPDTDALSVSLALDRLDPLDRQLALMRFVDEYTWNEIADITGLTVAQVRQRVDSALQCLHKWLGGKEEESTES